MLTALYRTIEYRQVEIGDIGSIDSSSGIKGAPAQTIEAAFRDSNDYFNMMANG